MSSASARGSRISAFRLHPRQARSAVRGDTSPRRVIGVVRDYHFSSLHDAIEPLVIATAFWGGQIAVKAQGVV